MIVASSEVAVAEVGDEVGQRERQAGAVGHHVREPRVGRAVLERGRDRGHLAVQRGRDHGHAVDRLDLGERLEVLLGAADVGLEARVAALDDVAGPALAPRVAGEVPVHDVPAAGAEPELDRGRVHDDAVAERDRPGELRQHVRALGPVAEVDLDPLQPGPLLEQPDDRRRCGTTARLRRARYRAGDEALDALVARLERVLAEHGALRLVVELQVHPVDRVVALALLGPLDERAAQPGARASAAAWSIAVVDRPRRWRCARPAPRRSSR